MDELSVLILCHLLKVCVFQDSEQLGNEVFVFAEELADEEWVVFKDAVVIENEVNDQIDDLLLQSERVLL